MVDVRREPGHGEITELLAHWYDDDSGSRGQLLELTYRQLRSLAASRLRGERLDHTLSATALVNEAYLRLDKVRSIEWKNRNHFMAFAAQAMRRVLLDYARERLTDQRGGGVPTLPLDEALYLSHDRPAQYLRLVESLGELSRIDPLKASIVDLRYFAGLTLPETAAAVGLSRATIARHWKIAMGWLYRELNREVAHEC